jgi:hypothetical protein
VRLALQAVGREAIHDSGFDCKVDVQSLQFTSLKSDMGRLLQPWPRGRPGFGGDTPGGNHTARRWAPRRQRTRQKPSCRSAGPNRGASSIGPPSAWTSIRASKPVVIWLGRKKAAALRRLRIRVSVTGSTSRDLRITVGIVSSWIGSMGNPDFVT